MASGTLEMFSSKIMPGSTVSSLSHAQSLVLGVLQYALFALFHFDGTE